MTFKNFESKSYLNETGSFVFETGGSTGVVGSGGPFAPAHRGRAGPEAPGFALVVRLVRAGRRIQVDAAGPAYPAAAPGIAAAVQICRGRSDFPANNAAVPPTTPGYFGRIQIRQGFVQYAVVMTKQGTVTNSPRPR